MLEAGAREPLQRDRVSAWINQRCDRTDIGSEKGCKGVCVCVNVSVIHDQLQLDCMQRHEGCDYSK